MFQSKKQIFSIFLSSEAADQHKILYIREKTSLPNGMLLCTVGVICDSTSICIPRDDYCTIDTYVYNITVNFTVKILVANVEA